MTKLPMLRGALMALMLAAGGAQATLLSTLLNGGSITAGDKVFDDWALVNYTGSDPNRSFNAANIDVTALNDGGLNPGPGLSFAAGGGELSVTGDGVYAFVDLTFAFHVSVLTPGLRINDASLVMTSSAVTNADDNGSYILETIGSAAGLADLGVIDAEFSWLDPSLGGPGLTVDTRDSTTFGPHNEVWVTKNILVWAVDTNTTATLASFEQRFSQIPEPTPLALLGLSLAGLALARRQR